MVLPQPHNMKQRSRLVAWSLVALGSLFLFVASSFSLLRDLADVHDFIPDFVPARFGGFVGVAADVIMAGLFTTLGLWFYIKGRRRMAENAESLLRRDPRSEVFYMHPFSE